MRCSSCEQPNEPGSRFCERCGGVLDLLCDRCGGQVAAEAQFCRHCGASLGRADDRGDEGERRQLTVMFCDLVGSTQLAQRLDPEELRETVGEYQAVCADAVKRFEGHVAQYLGDGVLVYFGFPRAHELAAERAVRAGLAIQSGLAALDARRREAGLLELSARIGIHTGLVVVSSVGGENHRETLAVGDATNVAARIESVAAPGTVVISDSTLRLVSGLFETRDLGSCELKGVEGPARVHQVTRGSGVGRRDNRARTPLQGRARELGLLWDRWERVRAGRGQVIALSGEPGIGKTRLIEAFRERLAEEPHTWLEIRCSPYISGSAFQPLVELAELGLGAGESAAPEQKLAALEGAFSGVPGMDPAEVVPYLAALLGLPPSGRHPMPQLSPERLRESTLRALLAPILAMEVQQPVLVVCEDLHWADPSTLELVGRLVERVPALRVCCVLTARPEFDPPWSLAHSHVEALVLSRLTRSQTAEMIEAAAGRRSLPRPVLDRIVSRADGVPLFAEELARSVLDSGLVAERSGRYELRGRISDLTIPSTLRDSLMARLDRLSAAKRVAQLAATLGHEFSYGLIEAVSDVDVSTLRSGLEQLVEAEILYGHGLPPDSTYTFKHSLLQDTAYQSQLKSRRRTLHARAAAALEERFPQRIAAEPELMARHCARGGLSAQAVTHLVRAGEQAIERFANTEAVEYFARALELLDTLPAGRERDSREIELRLAMAGPSAALHGYEDPAFIASTERIEALCSGLGEGPERIPALIRLAQLHGARGSLFRALRVGKTLLRIAEPLGNPMFEAVAHTITGSFAIPSATVPEACFHLGRGLEIGRTTVIPPPTAVYDLDLVVVAQSTYAIALGLDARPAAAIEVAEQAIARARELDHPNTLANALGTCAAAVYFLDDAERSLRWSDEALSIARGRGFHTPESLARVFGGWARVFLGEAAAVDEVEAGLESAAHSGTLAGLAQLYITGADAFRLGRRFERSAECLESAAAVIERTGERSAYLPQLPMIRARILLDAGRSRPAEVEALLRESIALWQRYGCPLYELRTTVLLAQTTPGAPDTAALRERVARLCERFSDGVELAVLREARALLAA